MTRRFFRANQEITIQSIDNLLCEFSRSKNLNSLLLGKIANEWLRFANNNNNNILPLPEAQRLPIGNPPAKPGIYAIFAQKNKTQAPVCFHVGISSNNVRNRLKIRLYDNVEDNYREVFGWLDTCVYIHICSATVTTTQTSAEAKKQLKAKLALLEIYLTALLKPKSLLLAAGLH